jgi:hypothetical protein
MSPCFASVLGVVLQRSGRLDVEEIVADFAGQVAVESSDRRSETSLNERAESERDWGDWREASPAER